MGILKQVFGVDISADTFQVRYGSLVAPQEQRMGARANFSNARSQFSKLLRWVRRQLEDGTAPVWFVMEATGVYHETLAYYLVEQGYSVSIIMPKKTKAFAQSLDNKSKTDDQDAYMLTRFGLERSLVAWHPPQESMRALRGLTREYQSLTALATQVRNQLHAIRRAHHPQASTEKRLKAMLKLYRGHQKHIEKEIRAIVARDPDLTSRVHNLETIQGVGFMTAIHAVAETWGFDQFTSAKQLVSFTGLDVVLRQSGTFSGRPRASKKGNARLRQALFMPAMAATRTNPYLRKFYLRLVERKKNKMIALIAVARKLLCLIYTIWKKNVPYDPNYHLHHQLATA